MYLLAHPVSAQCISSCLGLVLMCLVGVYGASMQLAECVYKWSYVSRKALMKAIIAVLSAKSVASCYTWRFCRGAVYCVRRSIAYVYKRENVKMPTVPAKRGGNGGIFPRAAVHRGSSPPRHSKNSRGRGSNTTHTDHSNVIQLQHVCKIYSTEHAVGLCSMLIDCFMTRDRKLCS